MFSKKTFDQLGILYQPATREIIHIYMYVTYKAEMAIKKIVIVMKKHFQPNTVVLMSYPV